MNTHIKELQDKAFNGDKDAMELYQVYVNKGEAPAIYVNESIVRNVGDMYKDSTTFKRDTFIDKDVTRPVHEMSALEKMMQGFKELHERNKEGEK